MVFLIIIQKLNIKFPENKFNKIYMNLIVSTSKNDVIGLNGQMLWNISSDIERYRKITKGGILIMGNTTYKSLRKKRLTYHYNIEISS